MWPAATSIFFLYAALASWVRPGVRGATRLRVTLLAAAGASGSFAAASLPSGILRTWLLPPVVLLIAYWTSGLLFVEPMPRVEALLLRVDRTLRVPQIVRRTPPWLAIALELAYVGVYPLIPIALAVHLAVAVAPDAERFWTVVLVTDFICFGMLPWIQTRPPRALEPRPPWCSSLRRFNVRMLGETSIGVNTVPSGHAAEAFAAALLVSNASAPVEGAMWLAAVAVSAGAVLGRYHFAVDAIAGWGVALLVWITI